MKKFVRGKPSDSDFEKGGNNLTPPPQKVQSDTYVHLFIICITPIFQIPTYRFRNPILVKVVNLQAPVAQKIAQEVVFRRFRGEGVEFF